MFKHQTLLNPNQKWRRFMTPECQNLDLEVPQRIPEIRMSYNERLQAPNRFAGELQLHAVQAAELRILVVIGFRV